MTKEEFEKWLDGEISWNRHLNCNAPHGDSVSAARRDILEEVKIKYLSTIQPLKQ